MLACNPILGSYLRMRLRKGFWTAPLIAVFFAVIGSWFWTDIRTAGLFFAIQGICLLGLWFFLDRDLVHENQTGMYEQNLLTPMPAHTRIFGYIFGPGCSLWVAVLILSLGYALNAIQHYQNMLQWLTAMLVAALCVYWVTCLVIIIATSGKGVLRGSGAGFIPLALAVGTFTGFHSYLKVFFPVGFFIEHAHAGQATHFFMGEGQYAYFYILGVQIILAIVFTRAVARRLLGDRIIIFSPVETYTILLLALAVDIVYTNSPQFPVQNQPMIDFKVGLMTPLFGLLWFFRVVFESLHQRVFSHSRASSKWKAILKYSHLIHFLAGGLLFAAYLKRFGYRVDFVLSIFIAILCVGALVEFAQLKLRQKWTSLVLLSLFFGGPGLLVLSFAFKNSNLLFYSPWTHWIASAHSHQNQNVMPGLIVITLMVAGLIGLVMHRWSETLSPASGSKHE